MEFRPFQELLPQHVEITRMIDEELIHAIVVEYGTEDLNLLRQKLKQMRIFYSIGLPESVLELLVKLESSAVDSIEEVESQMKNSLNNRKLMRQMRRHLNHIQNCQRWSRWLIYVFSKWSC